MDLQFYTRWTDILSDTHLVKDEHNNYLRGGDVKTYNSKDNIIMLDNNRECIINGLDGFIIVESGNSLLVCKKEDEQQIKEYVKNLKGKNL